MSKHFITYFAILVGFLAIDMIWLLGIAKSTYAAEMGSLMKKQPNLVAAGVFYLLYVAGIWFFAVRPTEGLGLMTAIGYGAALGLVAYGTYDLTNLTVTEGFGVKIAMIDLVWGTVVTAIAAAIGSTVLKALG
jgi:uncharacterized membrane protein